MVIDVQQALLSKIVHDEDIATVVNARITPEFFTDDRWRRVYEFVLDHWRRYAMSPDLPVVHAAFPSYDFPEFSQSVQYFIDMLRRRRKRAILTDALSSAAGYFNETDEPNAMDLLEEGLRDALTKVRLETAPTFDLDFFDEEGLYVHLQDHLENPGYLRGISTGFNFIDMVTGGFQPEQFTVIIGLPKSMKSSTLLYMAMRVHAQGKMPLFIGFEMSNEEQKDRLCSLYGEVGLSKILNGTFTPAEQSRIERAFKIYAGLKVPFITSVDLDSAMTVSGVQGKILEYNPDVVLIDGAYLMQSELLKVEQGSAQAMTNIARELKKLAQFQRIPIIVTTQASETRARGGKLTAASAMYTQAWRQSADVMIGTEREEGDDQGEVVVRLKVLASRSGPRGEAVLTWDWSKGQVKEQPPDYFKRRDDDEDGN